MMTWNSQIEFFNASSIVAAVFEVPMSTFRQFDQAGEVFIRSHAQSMDSIDFNSSSMRELLASLAVLRSDGPLQ